MSKLQDLKGQTLISFSEYARPVAPVPDCAYLQYAKRALSEFSVEPESGSEEEREIEAVSTCPEDLESLNHLLTVNHSERQLHVERSGDPPGCCPGCPGAVERIKPCQQKGQGRRRPPCGFQESQGGYGF